MFRYREKQTVVLTANYETIGLQPGSKGIIWALYDTAPPSYEVTFRLADGTESDLTVSEDEVVSYPESETGPRKRPVLVGAATS